MKQQKLRLLTLLLIFSFIGFWGKAQESIQLSDLVGKWKLTKVEEVQMQGDAELSKQEYTPTTYSGEIPFEGFTCTSDSKLSYSGRKLDWFKEGGNIQLNEGSNNVFFHGKPAGLSFIFDWEVMPVEFSLEKLMEGNQQSAERKMVKYYYVKKQ